MHPDIHAFENECEFHPSLLNWSVRVPTDKSTRRPSISLSISQDDLDKNAHKQYMDSNIACDDNTFRDQHGVKDEVDKVQQPLFVLPCALSCLPFTCSWLPPCLHCQKIVMTKLLSRAIQYIPLSDDAEENYARARDSMSPRASMTAARRASRAGSGLPIIPDKPVGEDALAKMAAASETVVAQPVPPPSAEKPPVLRAPSGPLDEPGAAEIVATPVSADDIEATIDFDAGREKSVSTFEMANPRSSEGSGPPPPPSIPDPSSEPGPPPPPSIPDP